MKFASWPPRPAVDGKVCPGETHHEEESRSSWLGYPDMLFEQEDFGGLKPPSPGEWPSRQRSDGRETELHSHGLGSGQPAAMSEISVAASSPRNDDKSSFFWGSMPMTRLVVK